MASTAGLKDVDLYFSQIEAITRQYRRLVTKLEAAVKDSKRKVEEIAELCSERTGLQTAFIDKKNACKANIKLLLPASAELRERVLADLKEAYREVDADFKALGIMADRSELLDGAPAAQSGPAAAAAAPSATNTELLGKALETEKSTTDQLRVAAQTVSETQSIARETAVDLEENREIVGRINRSLDEVESELAISAKLITRFMKRLYTDKVIIAFTVLLVLGLVGIIVYASLNPNQTLFNVPDAAIPTSPFTSPTPSPSLAHRLLLLRGADAQ